MSLIKDIVWGKKEVSSRLEFKYAMLRGEFAIMIILIGVFYTFIDIGHGVFVFLPWYGLMIVMSITAMFLNRRLQYTLSNIIILFLINFLVFLFADTDHPNGGIYFYFMTASMAGLILTSYYNLVMGIFFALLPIALAYLAFLADFHIIPPASYDASMVRFNFLANLSISLLSTMFMLQFLLNRNSESELSLERQNELLGKTNKELDHFVYSVSHDLRAPLSSILGLTTIYNLATSEQEKASIVNMIRDRARTLDSFISEVLDYSRNTRVELKLQKVMLLELIDELLEGILHMNGAKEVAIDIQVASDLSIATDRERIKVVLSNILSNAIYYRDPSKKSTLVIETEIQDGSMLIRIRDNGIGIKKEHLHRIFEMFYKAHDRAHGSGLGLYIVRETLHRLQGEITVDSTYAVSSTFTIRLPITPSVLAEGSAPVLVDSQAHS